ncbi:hypothetical protein GZH47_33135 (plasmid) [Paenibacillus rhizovicinus]|uniref:Uncharacterized protein n=1 Tax=Paenibacillus rhizovicinus TaxID=2704463 RepID=A0A6C0PBC5_9BACL|nr:hypothetical protein [Paenibacillus rhizovicinus]QHW35739.1 hypothetical protein GZH47_33135 [Paenibacillus rhizovicinus]
MNISIKEQPEVIFLHDYYFRFYGRTPEDTNEKGLLTTVSALDEEQAMEFAEAVADKMATMLGIERVLFERYHARNLMD